MSYRSSSRSSFSSFSSNSSRTSCSSLDLIPLRVFLIQTAKGLFSSSGGYKANICLLRHLASRGHCVRQLCYSQPGEIEAHLQTMARCGGRDPPICRKVLHLRAEGGRPSTDVGVEEFTMDDGVQIVALDSEAFHTAFGGKENVHDEMGRETAAYIEVSDPSPDIVTCFIEFRLILARPENYQRGYSTLSPFCKMKSHASHPRISSPTMAFPCKPLPPSKCPTLVYAASALYILLNNSPLDHLLVVCRATSVR